MDDGAPGPSLRTIRIGMAVIIALVGLVVVLLLVDVGGGDDQPEAVNQTGVMELQPEESTPPEPMVNSATAQSLLRNALVAVEVAAVSDPGALTPDTLAQIEPNIAWSGTDSDASRDQVAFTGDANAYTLVSTDSAGTRWIITGGPSGARRQCEPATACSDGSW